MKLDSTVALSNFVNNLAKAAPNTLTLKEGEPEFGYTLLSRWIGKELAVELLSTLNAIRLELVPKYAEDRFLVNAFWDEIVCEVTANHPKYSNGSRATFDLIQDFGDRWKPPLDEFHVIYDISNLKMGNTPISLDGVEFFAATNEALTERSIRKSDLASWRKEVKNLTLASVRVNASSNATAFETGKEQVADAINLLKASALRGLAGKMPPDEFVQWKLTGHYIVKPIAARQQRQNTWGIQRQFGPIVIELGDYIRRGIEDLRLELLSALPRDIRERIVRSLYWISHSTTHESDDHKIVDLCTALEILLLPEGQREPRKGTIIALRYNLFGGDFHPPAVKWMYDRRNDVIHGTRLPVVTQLDTWHLRLICYTAVDRVIQTSANQPDTLTLQELVATVETEQRLTAFLDLTNMGIFESPLLPYIVKEAKARLNKLRTKMARSGNRTTPQNSSAG